MNFPYVPDRWDFGSFVLGCFFIALGFYLSELWAFFLGILLLEFGVFLFCTPIIAIITVGEHPNESKERDFIAISFFMGICILVITSLILANVYFGFDIRPTIKDIANNSSFYTAIDNLKKN